jgi:predicted Zn-dependent protease
VTTFHTQRLRWGEGNLSIIAHNNPLTTPGLSIAQRFCYAGSMIHWSGGLFKLGIYLTPLLMLFTGIPPVNRFTWPLFILTVLYVFGSIWGFKLVSHGYGSFWRSELFTMIGFWTQAKGTMRALFMRKLAQFVVTSKRGRQSKSLWPFVRPHTYFIVISLVALFWGWYRPISGISDDYFKPIVASCWAIFHTALAISAIRRSLWPEDRRYSYRHTVHLPVEFGDADEYIARGLGCTADLSENGIGLIVYQKLPVGRLLRVRVLGGPEVLDCVGTIVRSVELSKDQHGVFQEGGGYRIGIKFDELTPASFDAMNRIALHYAVPRLYEQYHATIPTWLRTLKGRFSRAGKRHRHSIRQPFRLPLVLEEDTTPETTSATDDVSREAMAAVLEFEIPVGSAREFQLHTPVGVIHGQAEVMGVSPRVYAARTYYRTILGFTHFHGQGRAIFDDLLAPSVRKVHGPALVPMKKPLPVPMARRVAYAVGVFFIPILFFTGVWFHVRMRDDLFLRDVVASTGPVSPSAFERVEKIYSDTVGEKSPPTDRLVLLVGALGKSGRGADADQVTQILAKRDQRNLDLQIANANAYLNARDYSKAKAEYERLLNEFQSGRLPEEKRAEMQLALARSSFHSSDFAGADTQFKDLIRARPEDLALRYEYSGILLNTRRLPEAYHVYDGVVPDRPGRLLLATVYTLALLPDEDDRQLDVLLKADPGDAEAQLLKADVLSSRNSTVQAEAIYSRLQKLNPGDPGIRSRLGFIALGSRKYDQALALFQQLVEEGTAQPQDVKGFVDAASAATALGDSQKATAVALVDRALLDWSDNPQYLARLAWVLRRVKTTNRELELLERAAAIDRGATPDITRQFVGALVESKQWDRALPLVEQAERTPETRITLAGIYLEKKRYADAEKECRAVLTENADDLAARDLLASVFSATGRHKEAVEILQTLARERPGDPEMPIHVAEALLAAGDAAGALARYTAGLEADFARQRLWDGFADAAAALHTIPPGSLAVAKRLAERGVAGEFKRIETLSRLA